MDSAFISTEELWLKPRFTESEAAAVFRSFGERNGTAGNRVLAEASEVRKFFDQITREFHPDVPSRNRRRRGKRID